MLYVASGVMAEQLAQAGRKPHPAQSPPPSSLLHHPSVNQLSQLLFRLLTNQPRNNFASRVFHGREKASVW